jgi:hypothetical protein
MFYIKVRTHLRACMQLLVNRSWESFQQRTFHEPSESWAWLKHTVVQFQALATMSSREENLAVVVVSCAALILASLNNKKRKTRRWCRTELYKKRSGSELMLDMKSRYICGQYKHFMRMSPTDFENLLSRIGSKISKEETKFARCSQTAVETRSCHDAVPTWTEHPFVFVEKIDSRRIRTSGSFGARDPVLTARIWFTSARITGSARKCIRTFTGSNAHILSQYSPNCYVL